MFVILSSLIWVYTICHSQQSDQSQGLHCHSQEQSDQGLHYLPFSAVWSGTTLFAILSNVIKVLVHTVILRNSLVRVYTICHSQKSDLDLHCLPFSAVWSACTLFVILSSLIWVYTVCHSQQSDQGLHYLPFSAVWSGSTLFAILNRLIKVKGYTVILRNNLIRVYTICHSQQSGQGLHYLPFSAIWSRSRSTLSFSGKVWSGSTLFVILKSLIKVYIVCHSQQSDEGLHYLPFSAVWSGSTLFTILRLIMVYTICNSLDKGIHYLPFFLSSIIKVYTVCNSQQSD